MVFLSFTKYSSQNLLYFDRSLALLRQESYSVGNASYKYKLYAQEDGQYILYLENESDSSKRYVSQPFPLKAGVQPAGPRELGTLTALLQRKKSQGNRSSSLRLPGRSFLSRCVAASLPCRTTLWSGWKVCRSSLPGTGSGRSIRTAH